MATLYVTSVEPYAGKTAICIGLTAMFAKAGLSVGYMKPVGSSTVATNGGLADEDAVFVSRVMNLQGSAEDLSPVLFTQELREIALREPTDKSDEVVAAHRRLAQGRDVLVMEGAGNLSTGHIIGVAPARIAELTDAAVVAVVRYKRDMSVDDILLARDVFGNRLAGTIVNYVPEADRDQVRQHLATDILPRNGIRLLGVLPQDNLLNAITVGELTTLLRGRVLCRPDKQGELVETFTIGAMTADSALRYFLRSPNKAVITGGDRSEIQLAALQTSTKAIILTGNLYPAAIVMARADELGVPMILVPWDTRTTVEKVEQALGRIRLSSPTQVERVQKMVEQEVDIAALRSILKV